MINELRHERMEQLGATRSSAAREAAMAADMRSFSSAAHSALDEKERIKSRLRRFRHEWKSEKATVEAEMDALVEADRELDRLISQGELDEETALQLSKRKEFQAMRRATAEQQALTLRAGYLRSQLESIRDEFRRLGEVAGLLGKNASATDDDKFLVDDPKSSAVLIRTMRQNDARNESEHAFLQELDGTLSELEAEVAIFDEQEGRLLAGQQAAANASQAAQAVRAKATADAAEGMVKYEKLHARLEAFTPSLVSAVGRLQAHFATLEDAPISVLQPVPARSLPEGLEPLPSEQPLHANIEVALESLDALIQQLQSRVTRLSAMRGVTSPEVDEEAEESRYQLHPHLRMFTELPPEFSFVELKEARTEIEQALSRKRESDDFE